MKGIILKPYQIKALQANGSIQVRVPVRPMRGMQAEWLSQEMINRVPRGRLTPSAECGMGWQMYHPRAGEVYRGVKVSRNSPFGWIRCPLGKVGNKVFCKETFWGKHETEWSESQGLSIDHGSDLSLGKEYHDGTDCVAHPNILNLPKLQYQQTINIPEENNIPGDWWLAPPDDWDSYDDDDHIKRGQWEFMPWELYTKHPSIHMPEWASRFTLSLTNIRVERLQDISRADLMVSGIYKHKSNVYGMPNTDRMFISAEEAYQYLWDSHAKAGEKWADNLYCWVYDLKLEG